MRKVVLIVGLILVITIFVILVIQQNYQDSPDYNYISAKLDIRNGSIKLIHTGFRNTSSKDKEIDEVADKYGFKNSYIGYDTTKQIIAGISNYNEVMEAYLKVRNGINWREKYQTEVDSLYNAH
jgi:hypothetical protein